MVNQSKLRRRFFHIVSSLACGWAMFGYGAVDLRVVDNLKVFSKALLKSAQEERDKGALSYARDLESNASVLQSYIDDLPRITEDAAVEQKMKELKTYLEKLNKKIKEWGGLQRAVDQLYALKPEEILYLKLFMLLDKVRSEL